MVQGGEGDAGGGVRLPHGAPHPGPQGGPGRHSGVPVVGQDDACERGDLERPEGGRHAARDDGFIPVHALRVEHAGVQQHRGRGVPAHVLRRLLGMTKPDVLRQPTLLGYALLTRLVDTN